MSIINCGVTLLLSLYMCVYTCELGLYMFMYVGYNMCTCSYTCLKLDFHLLRLISGLTFIH